MLNASLVTPNLSIPSSDGHFFFLFVLKNFLRIFTCTLSIIDAFDLNCPSRYLMLLGLIKQEIFTCHGIIFTDRFEGEEYFGNAVHQDKTNMFGVLQVLYN